VDLLGDIGLESLERRMKITTPTVEGALQKNLT